MSDEFTKEQLEKIEEAILKSTFELTDNAQVKLGANTVDQVIAELTKPKPVFKVGEVYFYFGGEADRYFKYRFSDKSENCRHLTPSEVPEWERDKAALKVAIGFIENNRTHNGNRTLEIIKELTE